MVESVDGLQIIVFNCIIVFLINYTAGNDLVLELNIINIRKFKSEIIPELVRFYRSLTQILSTFDKQI